MPRLGYRSFTPQEIKASWLKFKIKHGHFPTSTEMDASPHMLTARSIQRCYGGLVNLRRELGLEINDYTQGEYRSRQMGEINRRSLSSENEVQQYLINKFGEVCVHDQKKHGDHKQRLDFFVYARENFGVDVFRASSYHSFKQIINIKLNMYKRFPHRLFLVVKEDNLEQTKIDKIIKNKEKFVPDNVVCVTFKNFIKECSKIRPLQIDFSYNSFYKTPLTKWY